MVALVEVVADEKRPAVLQEEGRAGIKINAETKQNQKRRHRARTGRKAVFFMFSPPLRI
jgi:hypothetical protein